MELTPCIGAANLFHTTPRINHFIDQTMQKIQLVTGQLFLENKETPHLIEQRYKIHLLEFSEGTELTEIFLKSIGFVDVSIDAIGSISEKETLKKFVKEEVIPTLSRFCVYRENAQGVDKELLTAFIEKLNMLKIPSGSLQSHEEIWGLYSSIRDLIILNKILYSPFYLINEDLKKTIFSLQIELLKFLHTNNGKMEEDFKTELSIWDQSINKTYPKNLSLDESKMVFEVKGGEIPIICVEMRSLVLPTVIVSFHALPIENTKYFKEFSQGQAVPKSPYPLEQFSLRPHKDCNCMSFAVGRKAPGIITPNGRGTTPNRILKFHKELIENGCVNVETVHAPNISNLTNSSEKNTFTYLTAFVFDSGGSETGTADFHVYRCFFDSERGPIWMELAQAKGGIQFSKIKDTDQLILGIPANPQEVFCKGSWTIFAGYWLVPAEASFGVTLKNPEALITKKAAFVRFN